MENQAQIEATYFENKQWLMDRLGRFTGSEIHKLFTGGRKKGETFGQTAKSYITAKAAEILTQEVKEESDFKQAEWGKNHEFFAYELFQKETGLTGEYYGAANPKFFSQGDFLGVSPDWKDEYSVADFKCPFNSSEHLKNLMLNGQEDLKEERFEYYCQLQMSMQILGKKNAYFVSYDDRFAYDYLKIKIIEVLPDSEWIEEYKQRIDLAIEILKDFLKLVIREEKINATT